MVGPDKYSGLWYRETRASGICVTDASSARFREGNDGKEEKDACKKRRRKAGESSEGDSPKEDAGKEHAEGCSEE